MNSRIFPNFTARNSGALSQVLALSIVAGVLIEVSTSHAIATELPIYEIDAACARHKDVLASNDCISAEQSSYNNLKIMWPKIRTAIHDDCLMRLKSGGQNQYLRLEGCIKGPYFAEVDRQQRNDARRPGHFLK